MSGPERKDAEAALQRAYAFATKTRVDQKQDEAICLGLIAVARAVLAAAEVIAGAIEARDE